MLLLPGFAFPLLGLLAAQPGPITTPRVLVLETKPIEGPGGAGRLMIRDAVESAIKASGAEVVPAKGLPVDPRTCTEPACFARLRSAVPLTHVVRIDGEYVNDGYRLLLEGWSAASGRTKKGDALRCEFCTLKEMAQAAREQTTALLESLAGESSVPEAATPMPSLRSASPPAAATPTATPEPRPAWKTWAPWVSVGVGAGLAIWGARLISIDGRCEGAACTFKRESLTPGLVLVGAGGALAVAGLTGVYVWQLQKPAGDRHSLGLAVSGAF